jgi:hypothetical protein
MRRRHVIAGLVPFGLGAAFATAKWQGRASNSGGAVLTIDKPGNYSVDTDLVQANPKEHAVVIAPGTHNVTIFLRARIIGSGGPFSTNAGIFANGCADLKIFGQGGSIQGFSRNIWLEQCDGTRIDGVNMPNSWFRGIYHLGGSPVFCDNDVRNVGGAKWTPDAFCMGIETAGLDPTKPGSPRLLRNSVQEVYGVGSGETVGIAISDNSLDGIVDGNVVSNSILRPKSFGVWVGGESRVTVVHNHFEGFDRGITFSSPPTGFVDENSFFNVNQPILDSGGDIIRGSSDLAD